MTTNKDKPFLPLLIIFLLLQLSKQASIKNINNHKESRLTKLPKPEPTPTPWPEQFHALLYMTSSSTQLQVTDLWYDWPNGRNVNIIQKQLGVVLYDVEWNNGTSFYYTLGAGGECEPMEFGVGIPRPDFLDGARYLGQVVTDGFLCHLWEKVDFIWYYEDVVTNTPVRWDFYNGISTHVMTFEVGVELPNTVVQAPEYCFTKPTAKNSFPTFSNIFKSQVKRI